MERYRSYLLEYRYNRVQEGFVERVRYGEEGREDTRNRTLAGYRWWCHESPVMECAFLALREDVHRIRERERERVDIVCVCVCVCISVCVFRVALIGLCFVRGAAGGCPTGTSSPVRVYYSNVEQISVVDTPHQL